MFNNHITQAISRALIDAARNGDLPVSILADRLEALALADRPRPAKPNSHISVNIPAPSKFDFSAYPRAINFTTGLRHE